MTNINVRLFVLVLNTCVCFTHAFPFEIFSPYQRAPVVRMVPIIPMNYTSIRRSHHKLPPINPLAEQVLVPKNLLQRYRPEQIMERLSHSASNPHIRRHKPRTNVMNFESYTMKPMNINYNTVLATLTPETERVFNILNQTDAKHVPNGGTTTHRPHHKSSKPHKSHRTKKVGDRDTQIVQYHVRDHSTNSPPKRTSPKKSKSPKKSPFAKDELPIGLSFFDTDKNENTFKPITYAPVQESAFNRARKRKHPTSNNVNNQIFQKHDTKSEPTTMQSAHNTVIHQDPNFIRFGTVEDVPTTVEAYKPDDARAHYEAPEVYTFTLDDAVVRTKHSKKNALEGPVTTTSQSFDQPPPNVEFQPVVNYDAIPTEHIATDEPNYYYRRTRNNERSSAKIIRKIEKGRPSNTVDESGRYVTRQFRRVEARVAPVSTTEYPLTETNGKDELQIKATVEKWPLPLQRHSSKSRLAPNSRRRQASEAIARILPEQSAFESQQNLDVSPSYTKQRTQGFNSGEDVPTTPMTAEAHFRNPFNTRQTYEDEDAAAVVQSQTERVPPQNSQANYFQYANVFGEGSYNAGVQKGNEDHFVQHHETAIANLGIFQKRVKWGDKKGGFGEHYYDLNHHLVDQPADTETIKTR